MKIRFTTLVALALGQFAALHAQNGDQEHWVATWTTAQLLVRPAPAPAGPAPPPSHGFNNQTVRMMVRASIGGKRLRIKISNAFGSAPVALGAAHIAIRSKDSEIVPASDRALSFKRQTRLHHRARNRSDERPGGSDLRAAGRSRGECLFPQRNRPAD